MSQPYVSDRTGQSKTREYVLVFLRTYCRSHSLSDGTTPKGSLYDHIFHPAPLTEASEFKNGSKDPKKRYIGRASSASSGNNPDESLWCALIDMRSACRTLDTKTRTVLGLLYCAGHKFPSVAATLGLTDYAVEKLHDQGIDAIVSYLDQT